MSDQDILDREQAERDQIADEYLKRGEIPPGWITEPASIVLTAEQVRKLILEGGFIILESMYVEDGKPDKAEIDSNSEIRENNINALSKWIELVQGEGRMFDCGVFPAEQFPEKHLLRGIDLFWNGHSPHPFDQYIIMFVAGDSTYLICVREHENNPHEMEIHVLSAIPPASNDPDCGTAFEIEAAGSVRLVLSGEGEVHDDGKPILALDIVPYEDIMAPEDGLNLTPEEITTKNNVLSWGSLMVTMFLLMINTKFVETRRMDTAAKLNKARQARGKKPLPSFYRVISEDYITALTPNKRHSTGSGNGTHASPIGHMRRAHLRTLPKGDVMVRQTRVGMHDGKTGPFVRANYRLPDPSRTLH